MGKSNNNHSRGFLSNALGVAKKLSNVGLELVSQSKVNQIYKESTPVDSSKTIDGVARQKTMFDVNQGDYPQQILRNYVPLVTQQLLGRHYSAANKVANIVSPQLSDKVSDYLFDRLNTFSNKISSVDSVLDQAGIKDLEKLTQDVDRSKRLSQALAEQNKWIASLQGALTGATGVVGSSIDIPASIILALKTIYQVGRSYGFELNEKDEQDIIQYIFKQINLGILAEKQTLLMSLRAISRMFETHDVYQLQQILGSGNDIDILKKWFMNEQGDAKWEWLNHVPKFSALTKLSPVIGATISASYSWKLIEDVNEKSQEVFSNARRYLISHKDLSLSVLSAYEKSLQQIAQAMPQLSEIPQKDECLLSNSVDSVTTKDEALTQTQLQKAEDFDHLSEKMEKSSAVTQVAETEVDKQQSVSELTSSEQLATKKVVNQTVEKAQQAQKKPVKRVTKKSKVDNVGK